MAATVEIVSPEAVEMSVPASSGTRGSTQPAPFDYVATFRVMTQRRLQRSFGGSVDAPRSSKMLATLGFALMACGILSFSISSAPSGANATDTGGLQIESRFSLQLGLTENVLLILTAAFAVFAALRVIETVRLCVYWLSCGLLAYVLLMITCPHPECTRHTTISTAIVATTLGLMVATVFIWHLTHKLYPHMLGQAWCCLRDLTWWWGIQPHDDAGLQFTYRPEAKWFPGGLSFLTRFFNVPPRHFGYQGGLDADGKPHGFGTWHDSASHGEKLTGSWRHGQPIAPFLATEYVSGWTFAAVRVAYCHNRAEPRLEEYWWQAKRNPEGLIWGVASVECSVAGGFFKHMPSLVKLVGPSPHKSASWCRENLKPTEKPTRPALQPDGSFDGDDSPDPLSGQAEEEENLPESLVVNASASGLRVAGFERAGHDEAHSVTIRWESPASFRCSSNLRLPTSPNTRGGSSPNFLGVSSLPENGRLRLGGVEAGQPGSADWVAAAPQDEAVVFLHGFNSPVADALKRVAQLWTLGRFPATLHPYCFGWPGARDVAYFSAKAWCEDNAEMNADFTAFIASLAEAGYKRIHFLIHSMGAMIVNSALAYEPFMNLFLKPGDRTSGEGGEAKIRVSTCILINPDASLERFKQKDYALLRSICDHITMYGDHADGALAYSETFNRWKALGKHPFQLYRVEPIDSTSPAAPTSPPTSGRASGGNELLASPATQLPQRHNSTRVRGAPPPAAAGARNSPFDMDVIDVSWMDGNMHAMRHNFFNINRWMVDDLREILTTRRRAKLRSSRMTHRFSNVWSFLAVPTHVVNP